METVTITERLTELRGGRTYREIAERAGVTPQAVQKWERTGQVSRQRAAAYDAALGAGGEVLNLLGYTDVGTAKIDEVLARLDVLERWLKDAKAELVSEVRSVVATRAVVLDGLGTAVEALAAAVKRLERKIDRRSPSAGQPPSSSGRGSAARRGGRSTGAHTPPQGMVRS